MRHRLFLLVGFGIQRLLPAPQRLHEPAAGPARQLAALFDAHPRQQIYTSLGGNSPQARVNAAADQIARGEVRLALIAGAEAMQGLRLNRKAGRELPWTKAGSPAEVVGDNRWGSNEVEQRHHAHLPIHIYPLFENALRAQRGWSLARHSEHIGRLYDGFAAIARDNPQRRKHLGLLW